MDRDEQIISCLSLEIPELSLLPRSPKNQDRCLTLTETVIGSSLIGSSLIGSSLIGSSLVFFKVGATGF
ncbi:MAG: hypothetical protein CMM01_25245, partial [Rhodopirellula sp.]